MATAENTPKLACPRCDFVGKSEQSLRVHMARAHKRGRPKGKVKKKVARSRVGTRRRRSICSICGKAIKTPAALKAHMTRMHGGKSARRPAAASRAASPLQRQLMALSLAELADLHDVCRAELRRRLTAVE